MPVSLHNTLVTAWRALAANKLRAALTALGVIIGVASVIATLALGNGARAAVEASFRYLGSDQIQIHAKKAIEDGELVPLEFGPRATACDCGFFTHPSFKPT